MELRGKKVIVTGGVRGLGRQMVERLAAKGAEVTVFDRDADGLAELRLRGGVGCVECDVSDHERVAAGVARYHEEHGAADVLVNNAGILYSAPLIRLGPSGVERHDVEAWDSLKHMELVVSLEEAFGMQLTFDEIVAMQSVGEIKRVLRAKGAQS